MTTKHQRIIAVLIVFLLGLELLHLGRKEQPEEVELVVERPILIWYTDPAIQNYMENTAKEVSARYQVEVHTELVSEVDYIEKISEQSVAEEMAGPDVYVASSTLLEKAVLSGMTVPVTDANLAETYSEKAVQAVTYDGTVVARPFYIETCFLLYNRYYVDPDEVPSSIEEILNYAENFEPNEVTEQVENIFKWNVADVIDDYMFLGAYTNLGGPSGDDKSQVSIDLEKAKECMNYYQSLNEFFAIDADTVTSEEVIKEFIDGKTVFTIVNVPMLAEVDRAVEAGELPEYVTERTTINDEGEEETITLSYDPFYCVAPLPALTDELDSRGLSVTNAVVVNPYSLNRDAAEVYARYLTKERAQSLYTESGKLTACKSLLGEVEKKYVMDYVPLYDKLLKEDDNHGEHMMVYEAYEKAAEVPKIMELSNMWLQLEVVLSDIWRGEDAETKLSEFSELLKGQLD